MDEERITALEIKLAYLENFMQTLQNVVLEQGTAIDSLKSENNALRNKVIQLSNEQNLPHQKPPHY